MNQPNPISVVCSNGHSLRAPERAIGRTLPCPVCREPVLVSQPSVSLSDTGAMRILGDYVGSVMAEPHDESIVPPKDSLSDTGVMRILGDFVAKPESSQVLEIPTLRQCPACSVGISDAVSVCHSCRCYVGVAPDYLRTLTR